MRRTTTSATSIHKVRRRALGDKRARGHEFQRRGRRIRRADPSRIRSGLTDRSLTAVGGLVPFGMFIDRLGVPAKLRRWFGHIKAARGVVYPMDAQLRLLLDANVVGEARVFGLEALGADPLFVRLAGGSVPSVNTVYRDLCRFDEMELAKLELVMAEHGLAELQRTPLESVHLDVDTTVEPLFGHQQGALPGPNPRYQGRPSYHPLLACVAETRSAVGAVLRPGDRGFGSDDAKSIRIYVDRVRAAVGPDCRVVVRIDAAGDCTEILETIHNAGAHFIVKARLTSDLLGALVKTADWRTVDVDAFGHPTRQVAEVVFEREEWRLRGLPVRVVAVRSIRARRGQAGAALGKPGLHGADVSHRRLRACRRRHRQRVQRPRRNRARHRRAQECTRHRQGSEPILQCQSRRVPRQATRAQSTAPLRPRCGARRDDLAHAVAASRAISSSPPGSSARAASGRFASRPKASYSTPSLASNEATHNLKPAWGKGGSVGTPRTFHARSRQERLALLQLLCSCAPRTGGAKCRFNRDRHTVSVRTSTVVPKSALARSPRTRATRPTSAHAIAL